MLDPVRVETVVDATPEQAFDAFTRHMAAWWPLDTHSMSAGRLKSPARTVTVALHEGGEIVEVDAEGGRHVWGVIRTWAPPEQLAFSWFVGRTPKEATHVTVHFAPTDDGRCAVTLVHDNWEALGYQAGSIRDGYVSGWGAILGRLFRDHVAGTAG
ncbi:SRPBCC domain-containing protein [Pseudaestuariivita atlantica]|uniref:Activator of Hsp90 ATPase homologue 1/2-like C-terminal domain-containing protein n=1 Tax=Pseudaestuariivita atlantica TaxID=1317121 RepID=A0A0L1JQ20_9RHOB|nr:SRPBCC domain-containing protein [Pseudaestuariivita atlantica]KNG93478.1 hypothetical protein ATO11_09615 [Pseudaestuariivita atlantica]